MTRVFHCHRGFAAVAVLSCPSSCDAECAIELLNRIVTDVRSPMSRKNLRMHLMGAEDLALDHREHWSGAEDSEVCTSPRLPTIALNNPGPDCLPPSSSPHARPSSPLTPFLAPSRDWPPLQSPLLPPWTQATPSCGPGLVPLPLPTGRLVVGW